MEDKFKDIEELENYFLATVEVKESLTESEREGCRKLGETLHCDVFSKIGKINDHYIYRIEHSQSSRQTIFLFIEDYTDVLINRRDTYVPVDKKLLSVKYLSDLDESFSKKIRDVVEKTNKENNVQINSYSDNICNAFNDFLDDKTVLIDEIFL